MTYIYISIYLSIRNCQNIQDPGSHFWTSKILTSRSQKRRSKLFDWQTFSKSKKTCLPAKKTGCQPKKLAASPKF